jgi:hypothetical protein
MLELRIMAGAQPISPFDLPALLGRRGAALELGDTIDALIAFMDDLSGDCDLEDGGDDEPDDDAKGDPSWPEWHTRAHLKVQRTADDDHEPIYGESGRQTLEDDEDDDSDRCAAGDDMMEAGPVSRRGEWQDDDHREHRRTIGSEDDAEGEYPCVPQYQVDQRQPPLPEGYEDAINQGRTA